MHGSLNPAAANGKHGIARFVCALEYLKPLTAEAKHFGHERHSIEFTVFVQCRKNLCFTSNFDPVTYAEFLKFHNDLRLN
jgi:hypothetical protein